MKKSMSASLWAWEFLRRNPEYRSDWSRLPLSDRPDVDYPSTFIRQKAIDQKAAKWGLLAYENPDNTAAQATPFWAIGPTLDAEVTINGDPPLFPMLRKSGTRVSGLQLLGCGLVLMLKRDNKSLQLVFANRRSFDETDGVILRLPLNINFPARVARSLELWNIATGRKVKKIVAIARQATVSNFLSLIA